MTLFSKNSGRIRRALITAFSVLAPAALGLGFAAAKAEAPADIVAPETGFNSVVWYAFEDEADLGKDSLGNYDLVAKNVALDNINGGVALKDNGLLYAPALGATEGDVYTDFSDLVKGSFSVSMRIYARSNHGGGNYIFTTGSYGSHFGVNWVYEGFGVDKVRDFQKDENQTALFDSTFSWYRINMIYNEAEKQFSVEASKEGDETYAFSSVASLSETLTFGGHDKYGFTIGAQSHLGGWDDGHANAELSDGTKIYPNISDFRLYSGVIDETEVNAIKKYDADKLAEQEAPKFDARPIASWDFSDPENIGKDGQGNINLIVKDAAKASVENGALTLTNGGLLYAGNLGGGKDISDFLTRFTLSFDIRGAKITSDDGEHDIVSTARYGEGFRVVQCQNSLRVYYGGDKNFSIDNAFGDTPEWYKITVAGDTDKGSLMAYVNKIADAEATVKGSVSGAQVILSTELCLTFGGWSKFGSEDTNYSNPTLSDIRLYDFMFSSAQATQLLTEGGEIRVQTTDSKIKSIAEVASDLEVPASATESEILALDLPETVKAVNEANNTLTAQIIWTAVEKKEFSAEVTGFITGEGINNADNIKVRLTLSYLVDESEKTDIKPLVWYEFKDADNLGKDSMGNFDLLLGGNQQIGHNKEEGYITFEKEKQSYLYAPALFGNTDWSDLLEGGYTVSFTMKADNSIQAGDQYAITTAAYGEAFLFYGCYDGYEVIYSSGGVSAHKLRYDTGSKKDSWVTLTFAMDAASGMASFYVDGVLFAARAVDNFEKFSPDGLYTFAIGAQANVNGKDGVQFFEGSFADVKVYDFPLSAANVKDAFINAATETPLRSSANYRTVREISADTSELDLVLSADNTVDAILAALPATVTVKDDKDEAQTCAVQWLGRKGGSIVGYVKDSDAANIGGLRAEVRLSYALQFDVKEHGKLSDVKMDGVAYADGNTFDVGKDKTLSFRLSANNYYSIASVTANNQKLTPDKDGVYSTIVNDFTKISVFVTANEYTITYVLNNGEPDETTTYAYGESKELDTYFTREGYVFEGWYRDENLSGEKVTEIDAENPADITLYAKWTPVAGDSSGGGADDSSSGTSGGVAAGCQGCGGSMAILSASLAALGAGAFALAIKRRKND